MIKNKLLLVEDDTDVVSWIEEYLGEFGFITTSLETVRDAIISIDQNSYDLIILDINLIDFLGYEVLKHIEEKKLNIPVIVISANSEQKNKLHAFKLGACDYMVKPLDLEELEARIRVHLRSKENDDVQNNNELLFSINNKQIHFSNKLLKLTKTEYEILKKMIENKNTILSRETLCESLSSISSSRSLDYHIQNIRKKIDDNSSTPQYLVTEYGLGYKLIF